MRSTSRAVFHGSYRQGDVTFLLKPIQVVPIAVAEKERLIQSGARHYSEMLSPERLPSADYLAVFRQVARANRGRVAADLLNLAAIIHASRAGAITLISLARAGTPIGVILKHLLTRIHERRVRHYSISIIRDRGIDRNAIHHILEDQGLSPESVVFVDGWTGKGVIAGELHRTVRDYNRQYGTRIDSGLYVVSDLAGCAQAAACCEDYLIPSAVLNSTISGLISRTVLNEQVGSGDFHGCVYYSEFADQDLSVSYVDDLIQAALELHDQGHRPSAVPADSGTARAVSRCFVQETLRRFGLRNQNLLKPGIGEATRVLLRRTPGRVILRDPDAPEVAHLLQLAYEKNIACDIDPSIPYQAVSLIKDRYEQ